ncbi:hypothetical protein HMPREF1544_02175 [Mucor circinelloides 1006PhL]|uniref:Uncharacterized protein n=1 Tax=Mucor circinelloides f. circinelloides (strain 1006PhL) TaxID=1220926 RepID=S2JKS8_MUCC1|nr:hypothetical protein HMPREF1544_02175 [Mucor circinelloides 1006PhL]
MLGMDIIPCRAKLGMGKLQCVLVLCHTHELAIQVKHEYNCFSRCFHAIKTWSFVEAQAMERSKDELAPRNHLYV